MSTKALFVTLILSISTLVAAGETKEAAGRSFEKRGGTWVEKSIPSKFTAPEANSCVHRDKTWEAWRKEQPGMAEILDLGKYVSFWYPSAEAPNRVVRSIMGTAEHRYAAAEMSQTVNKAPLQNRLVKMVLNKAPVNYTTWGLIGGGAVVAGALASGIGGGSSNQSESPVRR